MIHPHLQLNEIKLIYTLLSLFLLFAGWLSFKFAIKSLGYFFAFLLALVFSDMLNMYSNFVGLIFILIFSLVLGFIFSKLLWHIHTYFLIIAGIMVSLLIIYKVNIQTLLPNENYRIILGILLLIIIPALFVFLEKFLIIIISSACGALLFFNTWCDKEKILHLIVLFLGGMLFQFALLNSAKIFGEKKKDE